MFTPTLVDWFLIGDMFLAFVVFMALVLMWDVNSMKEELSGKRVGIMFVAPSVLTLMAAWMVMVAIKTSQVNSVIQMSVLGLWVEVGILLMVFSWVIMIQKSMKYKHEYWTLLIGFGLIFLGMVENTLQQVVSFSVVPLRYGLFKTGAVFVSVGLYIWMRRLRNQEAIVEERSRYEQKQTESLLETIGEGIVITDEEGLIKYINPAFEEMMGFNVSDLLHKDPADVFKIYDLKDKPLPQEMLSNSAAVTAKKKEIKILMENKSGKKMAVLLNSAPIKVGEMFKGVVRVVHEFTEDLSIQRRKDDFFSIASHELRTPLTVIAGNLDIVTTLIGQKLNKSEKQMMTDAQTSADRLIKMVADFLNVSRLDQGRIKTKIVTLDACKLIKQVVDELTVLAKKRGLKLSHSCSQENSLVMADENLLKEILINLLSNSIKFTERGGVTIEHLVKDGKVFVRVVDTGMGIEKELQDKLFLRFQRAMERTMARKVGGTGLGLYISREFARIMGGDLYLVKSEIGKGTTLEFNLPLAKAKTQDLKPQVAVQK